MKSSSRFLYFIIALVLTIILGLLNYHEIIHLKSKPTIKVKLVDLNNKTKLPYIIKDILNERYKIKLVEQNYDLIFQTVYENSPEILAEVKNDKAIKIFYTAEAALPDLKDYDLTLGFDHIDDPRYIRLPYYYKDWHKKLSRATIKNNQRCRPCQPNKTNFACFLVSNSLTGNNWHIGNDRTFDGVIARDSLFHNLSKYKQVQSGGGHLNNIGRIIPSKETLNWLGNCKFVIAYENQSYDGYITEKPFQAYYAGAVPIYYSSASAVKDINKDAIIFGPDFANESSLIDYIKKLDSNDELYCKIWQQNLVTNLDIAYENVYAKVRAKIFQLLENRL